jgi:predicted PurR-regulated permease PerM
MIGQVFIGILQALALSICFLILGIPNVLTLTFLTMVVGIIPVLGAWLVWFPAAIYLFVAGDFTAGIIISLYGGLFVSNIDNFIRPYLLSRSSRLPISIGLIGTIGGLYFIGIAGLILGPLILAYSLIIIEFYKEGRLGEISRN